APRQSTKEQEVIDFLDERLHTLARQRFGRDGRRAAIRFQLEQARLRLQEFAKKQVVWVNEGWQIIHVEDEEDARALFSVPFPVDGEAIDLVGRIDRIDFHAANKTLRILDYKTADRGEDPDKTHRNKEDWIDLQLPLYRHLCRTAQIKLPDACAIQLG